MGNDLVDKITSNLIISGGGVIKAKYLGFFHTCLFATNRTGMSLVTSRLRNSLMASEFSCNRASSAVESATQTITSMSLTNSFQYFLHNSDPPTAKNQLYLDYSHWSFVSFYSRRRCLRMKHNNISIIKKCIKL